jgi:hypothetical protein
VNEPSVISGRGETWGKVATEEAEVRTHRLSFLNATHATVDLDSELGAHRGARPHDKTL